MDYTTSYGFEAGLRTLFRRCVQCPDTSPTCPTCATGESCVQLSGSCTQCPSRTCVPDAQATGTSPTPPPPTSSGPNVGVIVGAVIGGIVVICIITFAIYWFCVRGNQRQEEEEYEQDEQQETEYKGYNPSYPGAPVHRSQGSMISVRSVATTVLSRASNVIQIAFVPGITDRAGSETPNSAPPVPAIPAEHLPHGSPYADRQIPGSPYSDGSAASSAGEVSTDHYFTADDIVRNSTYSGYTTEGSIGVQRQSMASSLARESFASSIFQETPQMARGVRANVVTVNSTPGLSPDTAGHVPDVPQIDYVKYGQMKKAGTVQQIESGRSTPKSTLSPAPGSVELPADVPESSTAALAAEQRRQRQHQHSRSRSGGDSKKGPPQSAALQAAILSATKRASAQPTHGGLGSVNRPENNKRDRDPSPFSDANALKEESPTDETK